MKFRIVFSISLLVCPAALVAQLSVPKVGVARYADRTVRGVNGLEANLLVDSQILSSADAVSFSDVGGLISIAGRIQLVTVQGSVVGEFNSSESSPVLNIDGALTSAIAWLPYRRSLVYWNGKAFLETEVNGADIPGEVTSVQAVTSILARLLANDASGNVFQASVSLETGNVISLVLLPGIKGPAFQQYGFIVSQGANGLEIQAPNGPVRTLQLSAPTLQFERMSSEWVHISSPATHQDWALHLSSKAFQLSILPMPETALPGGSQLRHDQEVAK
jgi:hypothetical protein